MGLEVYWLQLAEDKLNYYSVRAGKRVARKLVNEIVDATIGIEKQPEIGQIEHILKHKEKDFRYLVCKNYKILYWINYPYNRIEVANVFDTRQNPAKMNETL
ncbi:type II toxin-antitoxin system RelE/ParE family toxin [Sinomicrobium soli]|uniref:type II toxin-antitoxin system RelE/ParE family toxin n=1 Tax=Sinomicrobium sp. N-1-3-6 TaxID=2219864 RepID=UPI000DCC4006|nr:type II toxin-antitoxin system RelE/ParE family toxin [Sinomicrobium sp. N-1-3-6]RAV29204.1 type II toxin-antitoxin system RelE/ParE family toxin [Sinomicrobium sp. N-1-3-6]